MVMSEAEWEDLAMEDLAELDWATGTGQEIAPGSGERDSWDELVIRPRFLAALQRLNPEVPQPYLQQAAADIVAARSQDAITENQRLHEYLVHGYRGITYVDADGRETTPTIQLLAADPGHNDWLAVRQVKIVRGEHDRRFDVVLYCNGLPVSIIELKKAGDAHTGLAGAHAQLQTYLREFPLAFRFCLFVLVSDGITAAYGTPFTPLHHFAPWNVDDDGAPVGEGSRSLAPLAPRPAEGGSLAPRPAEGGALAPRPAESTDVALQTALYGLYNQERFGQLMRSYTAFDETDEGLVKRIAKPHQYFAVTKAVAATVAALDSNGKAGVVWHTQGSGKSMEMELYAALTLRHPRLLNPTIVVITDRRELDGQLYESFQKSLLLPEKPRQIRKRSELRDELSGRTTGGIYFTTLQKFGRSRDERDAGVDHPLLSDRRNIIVVVDEAHRSHYDDLDGYARHLRDALPRATLIAFTGTPISFDDRNTQAVFGDYIDIYDLTRAVEDGATVPVTFEPRLIKVDYATDVTTEQIDLAADEATIGLDDAERARIEQSVAVVNAVYGAPERIDALAEDIVAHWERRRDAMRPYIESPGKALIVGATRRICADLYDAIVKLRPTWHSDELDQGVIKVVYSGTASDEPPISNHVRRDSFNKVIKNRLKDADDPLEIVIVKDMMLTGYDSPPLHTLYLDRPLKGALLMQTLARVNRTYRGKPDGLLVAYAPLVDNLQAALAEYTQADRETKPVGRNVDEAVSLVQTLVDRIRGMLADHNWKATLESGGRRAYLAAAQSTVNYLRSPATPGNQVAEGEESLADRYRRASAQLARAWALAGGAQTLSELRPEIAFYEEVRVWMAKYDAEDRRSRGEPVPDEIRRLLANLIATSTASGETLDIYEAAGMPRPTLDQLGPAFADQAKDARNPQLAIEALRALVAEESRKATSHNQVRARAFSARVDELMRKYTNSQLTAAEVIAELVALAKEVADEADRGRHFDPPLDTDELAFYDAVAENESAVREQGEDVLAQIARDLVGVMRRDVRTDWTVRDDVRAKLRSSIKRLLVRHGYPPDKQPAAISLVMEQMEAMAPRYAQSSE
ncbi:type I restriction enzyme R subunit [Mumia flava]|uniref:Type I restriction enzyme endonuclease subunit n=1 Tax=Mumia flava TaxID=1348852 RepID=A0A0B2BL14_9ACTN|nr:type I restriction endonuclease subunit R [Mumia flava]PJJ54023.1 type I restriction enzyme R subunit [Mumia flava]